MKKQTSTKTSRGIGQDRKLVSSQTHELRYEAEKMNTTAKAVDRAKKTAGRSRKKIEKKLK